MHAYWVGGGGWGWGAGNDFRKIVAMTRPAREVKRNVKLSPIVITHKKRRKLLCDYECIQCMCSNTLSM